MCGDFSFSHSGFYNFQQLCESFIGDINCLFRFFNFLFILSADYLFNRFADLVEGLVVYPERMAENLALTRGLVFSGTLLIALTDNGMKREDAYRVVQQHALAAWEGGATFLERVSSDSEISSCMSAEKLSDVFNIERHMAHVDFIFTRAKGEG